MIFFFLILGTFLDSQACKDPLPDSRICLKQFTTSNGAICTLSKGNEPKDDQNVRYEFAEHNMVVAQNCFYDENGTYNIRMLKIEDPESSRCADECYLNPLCWNFVWNILEGNCWLKTKVPSTVEPDVRAGFVCGSRTRKPTWQSTDNGAWWSASCNFSGESSWNKSIPLDQAIRIKCADHCVQNAICTHFAFNNGSCNLMSFEGKKPVLVRGNVGEICGHRVSNYSGELKFSE